MSQREQRRELAIPWGLGAASGIGFLLLRTVRPESATVQPRVYTAWSHLGRVHSEAAFAGVSPIPGSSGNTTRHRLNRGGDRRLNRALHMAAVVRMAYDPATRAYAERRRTEGKT